MNVSLDEAPLTVEAKLEGHLVSYLGRRLNNSWVDNGQIQARSD